MQLGGLRQVSSTCWRHLAVSCPICLPTCDGTFVRPELPAGRVSTSLATLCMTTTVCDPLRSAQGRINSRRITTVGQMLRTAARRSLFHDVVADTVRFTEICLHLPSGELLVEDSQFALNPGYPESWQWGGKPPRANIVEVISCDLERRGPALAWGVWQVPTRSSIAA